jgi:hypothetical protein
MGHGGLQSGEDLAGLAALDGKGRGANVTISTRKNPI